MKPKPDASLEEIWAIRRQMTEEFDSDPRTRPAPATIAARNKPASKSTPRASTWSLANKPRQRGPIQHENYKHQCPERLVERPRRENGGVGEW